MPAQPTSEDGSNESQIPPPAEAVKAELGRVVGTSELRRQQFPRAALVGVLAGLVAVAFRGAINAGETLRYSFLEWAHQWPLWGWVLLPLVSALVGGLVAWLTRHLAPEAAGGGIPHVKGVLLHLRRMEWKSLLPVKFVGGWAAISSGLSLGRQGPSVQMGAAVGDAVSRILRLPAQSRMTLTASGAGAGLAAAFNAPLAGVVFVLEELQHDFSVNVFGSALVSAVTADIVMRTVSGQAPEFHVPAYPVPPLAAIPLFLILGGLAGLLGVVFNKSLLMTSAGVERWRRKGSSWVGGALAGLLAGLVGWGVPLALGGGRTAPEAILGGQMLTAAIPLLLAARFVTTMVSGVSGVPGGIFAPILVLGALLGLAVGHVSQLLFPSVVADPAAFAVVGMAAYFTAIVRAPLTAVVLILEMTLDYQYMLPLLVASLAAYTVADLLADKPIYEALLERELASDQERPELGETLMLELTIQPGSRYDGILVRDMGLPSGCILAVVRRQRHEFVPSGNSQLQAADRITALISSEGSTAIAQLKECVRTPRPDQDPPTLD